MKRVCAIVSARSAHVPYKLCDAKGLWELCDRNTIVAVVFVLSFASFCEPQLPGGAISQLVQHLPCGAMLLRFSARKQERKLLAWCVFVVRVDIFTGVGGVWVLLGHFSIGAR